MKYCTLIFLVIIGSSRLSAQDIMPLVKAEREFEASCLEKGIREGFLSFADSLAIVFSEHGPVNARQFWSGLAAFDGVFSWSPAFGEVSMAGNWGYTSGNFEHRPKFLTDSPNAFGQYTTVWQIDASGKWKFLIDIGNPHPSATLDGEAKTIRYEKLHSGLQGDDSALIKLEAKFVLEFGQKISDAYAHFASSKYFLNLSGRATISDRDSAASILGKIPFSMKYYPAGIKVSPARDMAAVYGTINLDNREGNYLRIWRYEKTGWKIALEVIRI